MQDPERPDECCADWKAKWKEWSECAEKSVRDEPVKTVGLAFVAGIFLTFFPIGRLLAGLLQMAFALLRPALLILGVLKIIEGIDKRKTG
ncbi:MAG: hypothetical protein QOE70_22 [Chthoniobacter sp.]|jgi:hypothetical protein|nr:hypothetical protein [Chthoniobacter sp.]